MKELHTHTHTHLQKHGRHDYLRPEVALADVVPLSSVPAGSRVRLIKIQGGRWGCHRLTELGLTPGVELEVMQQNRHGPMLVVVRDTRLALGRGMADRVLVVPANGNRQE